MTDMTPDQETMSQLDEDLNLGSDHDDEPATIVSELEDEDTYKGDLTPDVVYSAALNSGIDGSVVDAPKRGKSTDHGPVKTKTKKQVSAETGEDDEVVSMRDETKKRRWYIIHTYSGHENKVKINLERRIESMNMGHKIFRVEAPQKEVTKIKDGRRMEKKEQIFPGYVLVDMIMDDDSWYCVRYTPGVTKFVGGAKKPIPARESEIKRLLMRTQPVEVRKVEIDLRAGETIQIISGPFADFEGKVTEVYADKEKVKASVVIFGRETPVELSFGQIQKVS